MQITSLGDSAVLIQLELPPAEAAPAVQRCIQQITTLPFAGMVDVVPSYTTVAVYYDAVVVARERPGSPFETVSGWLKTTLATVAAGEVAEANEHTIPVVYGGEFGPDLEDVAQRAGISAAEVIQLHSGITYDVRAVGFSPGFPFLSGLPAQLHTPRRATPRTRVAAGSIGIGGEQTGIYGITTPGGWNLIGRTPWILFDAMASPPCLLRVGDRVRFQALRPEVWPTLSRGPLSESKRKKNSTTAE